MSELGFQIYEGEEKIKINAEEVKKKIRNSLKDNFKPEFLNRIDEIIIFDSLSKENISAIADLQVALVQKRLVSKGINIELDKSAKEYLVKNGYSSEYGARELKRLIQKSILDPLAQKIVGGEIKQGEKLIIKARKEEIVFDTTMKIKARK
jgi:ATP-dependent Clp protease ATP-binding subunit ClpA